MFVYLHHRRSPYWYYGCDYEEVELSPKETLVVAAIVVAAVAVSSLIAALSRD